MTLALLMPCFALGLQQSELEFASTVIAVDPAQALALRDVDGDGDEDLLLVDDVGIRVRLQSEAGIFSDHDDVICPWPSPNLAWTLVDTSGDGRTRLATYVEGREVRSYRLDHTLEEDPGELELAFTGDLPRGRYEMTFYRDVNGDGMLDLVLPDHGSFAIHLSRADGSWAAPLQVRFETDVDYEVGDPRTLKASFGQDLTIPWFTLEDVDGDGDMDLVARTQAEVLFHLAEPELASTPTWRLDLAALRAGLPPDDGLDLSNLLGALARTVDWKIVDLDGTPPNDLMVQIGGKFLVYRDASRVGPGDAPSQILKTSGNVITFFVREFEGKELPDLQIIRVAELSMSTLLRWLILPGKLDFDLFTYGNEGGTFSRRPTRRNTLELVIPRLLAFISELEALEEEQESALRVPARRAALGADGIENDVVDLLDGEILVYHDSVEPADDGESAHELKEAIESFVLRDVDALADGETKTFDLEELTRMDASPGAPLRAACAGADPDRRISLPAGFTRASLHPRDLDSDGRTDLLLIGGSDEGPWMLQFLVWR